MATKLNNNKTIETLVHEDSKRKNIPTVEHQSVVDKDGQSHIKVRYPRNLDLDPQIVWRGKDNQDWSDLVVSAPPLYIQEKVHPKALIDDLLSRTKESDFDAGLYTADLFNDFDGIPKGIDKTDFYTHQQNWTNRLILGDSLQVMASLAEREGMRGEVQCIYFDPPYGIKFNSNFQWSTTSREVKDGNSDHITREPEQVKAFRDTWRDGIHSYLTYLRDRLTVARDLLTESGSIFIQIGDENVHRVRALLDEVFGDANFVSQITVVKTSGYANNKIAGSADFILWYAKNIDCHKYRKLLVEKSLESESGVNFRYERDKYGMPYRIAGSETPSPERAYRIVDLTKPGPGSKYDYFHKGNKYTARSRWWGTTEEGLARVDKANRMAVSGTTINYLRAWKDIPGSPLDNVWTDTGTGGFLESKVYVVQTTQKIIQRCILMATDPGDLVLDPTCGSGTTAFVSEQWGRRWITIDTSRVALALARARIMGGKFPYYLLSDSKEGQLKEAEITRSSISTKPVFRNIKHGFVNQRLPHITLKSIANNSEIDVIWEDHQTKIKPLLEKINKTLGVEWEQWEVPLAQDSNWSDEVKALHAKWLEYLEAYQVEIDNSISARAEFEPLYDKPYEDKTKVRVAGPFTVESLSPHRTLGVDENDNLIDTIRDASIDNVTQTFEQMILDTLKVSGVQQAHKDNRIIFSSLNLWPGDLICAEARYYEGATGQGEERRAAIFIGPEFGTVQRADLVAAAREAGDANFDALISCAFNYEAHATEFNKLGRIPVLKARMNADLHMADDLKNTGKGNLFVIFGEPDIELFPCEENKFFIKINGVDVFKPQTGEVVSNGSDGIACWFIDTDYNEESFFVRHAYFLGAADPYDSLKRSLKTEINLESWATLNSDKSRPFVKPKSGRIAVKVINHLGDEVMKVFKV